VAIGETLGDYEAMELFQRITNQMCKIAAILGRSQSHRSAVVLNGTIVSSHEFKPDLSDYNE
jgi:hypothetical protein